MDHWKYSFEDDKTNIILVSTQFGLIGLQVSNVASCENCKASLWSVRRHMTHVTAPDLLLESQSAVEKSF